METIDCRRKFGTGLALALVLAVALGGCVTPEARTCPAGLKAMVSAELYFGRAIPGGGAVGEADWQRFVDDEITPRFPDGLTVQDALGQWKDQSGIVREPSKRLVVVMSGSPLDAAKIAAIRTAYRTRFRQEAVLLLETPICGAF